MNRERELIIDDKSRDTSLAHREELMIAATSSAADVSAILMVVTALLSIGFFGFAPNLTFPSFIFLFFGAFVTTLYGPGAQQFGKWFSKINLEVKPRKNKKGAKPKKKSAEPEEAIFIGIND